MICLNDTNGASGYSRSIIQRLPSEFIERPIIAIEMGVAYGGGIEEAGKILKNEGIVYGFDTFEEHPKYLAKQPDDFEATCMDHWYNQYGTDTLKMDYIRKELDRQGLSNVKLIKGLINQNSCDDLNYIHYCLLDLDILDSMISAYNAVRDKIVPKGYLLLHDVIPDTHIPRLSYWYKTSIRNDGSWKVITEEEKSYLAILQKL